MNAIVPSLPITFANALLLTFFSSHFTELPYITTFVRQLAKLSTGPEFNSRRPLLQALIKLSKKQKCALINIPGS
jgi:hypothetical protein